MIFLTEYGLNTYVVMLQQLFNWQIDWDFMTTSLPWADITCAHVDHALWYCTTHEHPPSFLSLFREQSYLSETVYPVPEGSWAAPVAAPHGCCVHGRFCAVLAALHGGCVHGVCAVRHMQLLHHGRVPVTLDTLCSVTPWLLRLHTEATRRLLEPARDALRARLHDEDLVAHVLGVYKRLLMDAIWRRAYPVEYQ
jgi:hypothetical protein